MLRRSLKKNESVACFNRFRGLENVKTRSYFIEYKLASVLREGCVSGPTSLSGDDFPIAILVIKGGCVPEDSKIVHLTS